MNLFLFMPEYRKYFSFRPACAAVFICLISFLPACGTTGLSQSVTAGEPKNSIPFFEKSLVERLHSIAVPPFGGDRQNWHAIALDIFSSERKISLISPEKINKVLRSSAKDLSSVSQEERRLFMARLGRTVQADAVLNGVFFRKGERDEIILQIVSSNDSRILWWQSADLNFRTDSLSPADQKKVLSSLLAPLMEEMGKKAAPLPTQSKQVQGASSGINQQTEKPPRSGLYPSSKQAPKAEKRPEKDSKHQRSDDDISPM